MLIAEQFPITGAVLLGLNVPEQEDEWEILADDGTYAVQDVVRVGHTLYRALRDQTPAAGNSPTAEAAAVSDPLTADPDPLHWLDIGASNAYRLCDARIRSRIHRRRRGDARVVATDDRRYHAVPVPAPGRQRRDVGRVDRHRRVGRGHDRSGYRRPRPVLRV